VDGYPPAHQRDERQKRLEAAEPAGAVAHEAHPRVHGLEARVVDTQGDGVGYGLCVVIESDRPADERLVLVLDPFSGSGSTGIPAAASVTTPRLPQYTDALAQSGRPTSSSPRWGPRTGYP
jgi:hypothetical protein